MTSKPVSEKEMFEITSKTSLELDKGFFESYAVKRMMKILILLKENNEKIGKDIYQFDANDLLEKLDDPRVDTSTIYRFLRGARESGLIEWKRTKVLEYEETIVEKPVGGEFPTIIIKDVSGNVIPPSQIGENNVKYIKESGEGTLRMFTLMEKGEKILKLYLESERKNG